MGLRHCGGVMLVVTSLINVSRRIPRHPIRLVLTSLAPTLTAFGLMLTLATTIGCSQGQRWRPANQPDADPPTFSSAERPSDFLDADASDLLRKVVARYQGLSTYSDKGTSTVHMAGGDSTFRVEFETLSKKPGKLRFAWTVENNRTVGYKQRAVIWCDGTTAWSVYSFRGNKPEQKRDLELAVAGAIGASWGTAHSIPRLLFDEVGGIRLDLLQGLKVAGNDTVDGVECFVIVGYLASGSERKIWIGRKDLLIRRIDERSKALTKVETRRQIMVNVDIADSRFSQHGL